jgi:hypothetical protein
MPIPGTVSLDSYNFHKIVTGHEGFPIKGGVHGLFIYLNRGVKDRKKLLKSGVSQQPQLSAGI